jgi:hypothetical protein
MPGGEGRRGRRRNQRLDPRIGERRTKAIDQLLQNTRQAGGCTHGKQAGKQSRRKPPPAASVSARPHGHQKRPLHPPRRRKDEHDGERLPAQRLAGLEGKSVPLDELVEEGEQST